jgi:hypothetical protein
LGQHVHAGHIVDTMDVERIIYLLRTVLPLTTLQKELFEVGQGVPLELRRTRHDIAFCYCHMAKIRLGGQHTPSKTLG